MASKFSNFDEIDSIILRLLAADPRRPYSEIADELEDAGYEMSGEGIRYRVSKIIDATTVFFLLDPKDLSQEIMRIAVTATDDPGAKDEVFEMIAGMQFWHVTRGLGTYDVYAVGMAPSLSEVDDTLTSIREHESVATLDHIVVTERQSDLDDYYYSEELFDDT